jgi:hypothetical protein
MWALVVIVFRPKSLESLGKNERYPPFDSVPRSLRRSLLQAYHITAAVQIIPGACRLLVHESA